MSARETQGENAMAPEMVVQPEARANGNADAAPGDQTCSIKSRNCALELTAENGFCVSADTSLLAGTRIDVANLIRVLLQLEVIAKRQAPRIAFKARGRILFLDLAEIEAVQAEGNYVSLQHGSDSYLLRESLLSMEKKLKPYGFVRVHRSVVVNMLAVEEIQTLPSGEHKLRVKGGKEYLVTRTYRDNLGDLAQLWVGSECFCG